MIPRNKWFVWSLPILSFFPYFNWNSHARSYHLSLFLGFFDFDHIPGSYNRYILLFHWEILPVYKFCWSCWHNNLHDITIILDWWRPCTLTEMTHRKHFGINNGIPKYWAWSQNCKLIREDESEYIKYFLFTNGK